MLVTRFTDPDEDHCSPMSRMGFSPTVNASGLGISREGDLNTPHLKPPVPCKTHNLPIMLGSVTVYANGKGVGRDGDLIWCQNGGKFLKVDMPLQTTVHAGAPADPASQKRITAIRLGMPGLYNL